MTTSGLFHRQLELPVRGLSNRVTRREDVESGRTLVLFEETGPACLLHWWLTYSFDGDGDLDRAHTLRIRVFYDDAGAPAVDVTLAQFFANLLKKPIYPVNSAAVKVLPKNACNCYLPMPFQKLRLELINTGSSTSAIWFMGDWQAYPALSSLTPMRLSVVSHGEYPAEPRGSLLMADIEGRGFIAGIVKGVRVRDTSDAWFHSGGDLWLIDGEGAPRAIRGIGGEDIFNMSFGIWEVQNDWVGAPCIDKTRGKGASDAGYEAVMYRFFGPAPIWFDRSIVARFGSKANDIETVVYAYLEQRPVEPALSPREWLLAGPFECADDKMFDQEEWAENDVSSWPEAVAAGFGLYAAEAGPTKFQLPVTCRSEHTWCDFARHFRSRRGTNIGTQPVAVSAYAAGHFRVDSAGAYVMRIGFDDRLKIWIDGRRKGSLTHDAGFAVAELPCDLEAGEHEVRIKLSNANNRQWRLWAFSFRVEGGPKRH